MKNIVNFPRMTMWDTNSKGIDFINGEDFHLDDILETLGLQDLPPHVKNSLGVIDREEIIRRQSSIRFLMENPEIETFLSKTKLSWNLPTENQNFVEYFGAKGGTEMAKFNEKYLKVFKKALEKQDGYMTGTPIAEVTRYINSTKFDVLRAERAIGDKLMPELENRHNFEGHLAIKTLWKEDDKGNFSRNGMYISESEVFGRRRYSFYRSIVTNFLPNLYWKDITNNVDAWIWRIPLYFLFSLFLPLILIFRRINGMIEKYQYTDLITSKLPDEIARDIKAAVYKMVHTRFQSEKTDNQYTEFTYKVFFRYNQEGLYVRLYDCLFDIAKHAPDYLLRDTNMKFTEVADTFRGLTWYSKGKLKYYQRRKRELNRQAFRRFYNIELHKQADEILSSGEAAELVEGCMVPSKWASSDLKFSDVHDVINADAQLKEHFVYLNEYRKKIHTYLGELRFMLEITARVSKMVEGHKSSKWCFPEILDDSHHLISFDKMNPMHLIGHKKLSGKEVSVSDLVPLSRVAPLNGQMMCLTGQNAGGKTATKMELVYQVFLAQSGFPVFSKSFSLNPKRVIGLVFVERGKSGSFFQMLSTKINNIFDELERHKGNHVLVVIDELLTGTQEARAFEIGRRILRKLNSINGSTIFSTQITALAEYAEEDLNALTYGFDEKHHITPGISLGNPELIIKQIGMEKHLTV